MRILLLAPAHESCARGNLVTVDRWRRGLLAENHFVQVSGPDIRPLEHLNFDLVHAHHAVHCGPKALEFKIEGLPVVVSLGGTDLNGGPMGQPDPRAQTVYETADRIIGPFLDDAERLRRAVPHAAAFRLVRRGVELREAAKRPPRDELIGFMAGGIREVKGQLRAIAWLKALRQRGLKLRLLIAGPKIEADYFQRFEAALMNEKALQYLGVLSPEAVEAQLDEANFMLNASLHEGASNALLEALASGCPVAATRVAGNTQMLQSAASETALLFDDDEIGVRTLGDWLEVLKNSDSQVVAAKAQDFVRLNFSAKDEIAELLAVYREISKGPSEKP